MEELFELRNHIEQKRYADALNLLAEMEEMSKDDKINKICSFAEILLLHLIKREAESRTTRSWDLSIWNSTRQIARVNKRRKASGSYLQETELRETISEAFESAIKRASLEVFEGRYDSCELGEKIDRDEIEREALGLIRDELVR